MKQRKEFIRRRDDARLELGLRPLHDVATNRRQRRIALVYILTASITFLVLIITYLIS